jgi:CrcB protein
MWYSILAISLGAVLGANLRWWLGVACNHWFPDIPPGTLIANLLGGWCIGIAIAYFSQATHLAPEWRLFLVTGLLGSLTTFSTFSAEVFTTLQSGKLLIAAAAVSAHVIGSLLMTALGILTFAFLKTWQWG